MDEGSLIIDKQNPLVPSNNWLRRGESGGARAVTLRQVDGKRATLPWSTLHGNRPPVIGNNTMHDRQAHAGPFTHALGGEERLEDAFQDLGLHAIAGILNRQPYICPRLDVWRDGGSVNRYLDRFETYFDHATGLTHSMGRVGTEVNQHLLH